MNVQDILAKYQKLLPTDARNDGYWYINIPDPSRKEGRRKLKSRTYSGLLQKILEYESGHYSQIIKTFEEMYYLIQEQRLEDVRDQERLYARTSTVSRQDSTYRRYFQGTAFAEMPLDRITARDIDYVLQLNLQRYSVRHTGFKEMTQIIKRVFDKAYRRDMIQVNPCDKVEWNSDVYSNKFISSTGIKKRTYTDDEMNRLWDHELDVIRRRPGFLTAYAMLLQMQTGLRRGEVCGLRWSDITTDESGFRYLTIYRELVRVPKRNGIPEHQRLVEHTKTSRDRTIPIWPELAELLDAIYAISGNNIYIFPGDSDDGCLGIYSVYAHYRRSCSAIGIPIQKDTIRGPHAWRRNFAKRMGDSEMASHLLGNTREVCEQNYSDAIDFDEARQRLTKKALKKSVSTLSFIR